jgi:hypothetical protein
MCEFLNQNTRFGNECKARLICTHHWFGMNKSGDSFHECSMEGSEFSPEETFEFGVGFYVES